MGFSVRTGAGAPNLRVPPRSCGLDFGLDFLFAHPGGSVFVGFVVEHVQGLHQPTVVLRGSRRDFVHVERKSPLDDSPLEENTDDYQPLPRAKSQKIRSP